MSKLTKFKRNGRRLLTLGLAPIIAITISSCSNSDIAPANSSDPYLTVGNYQVTKGDVWNELRWQASDLFADYKEQIVLQNQIDDIKNVLNDKNNANYNYYVERLQNYIIEDAYDFDFSLENHDEEIEDLSDTDKEQKITKYADDIYTTYRVNISIDQIKEALTNYDYASLSPLYEIYYNDFASELYAREKLQEEINDKNEEAKNDDDDNTVGYFSKSEIVTKYEDNYLNQGDVDIIMIRFASEEEMNNTLRAFGIKVNDGAFYYLPKTPTSYNDYISYYEDFDFDEADTSEYFNLDSNYGHSIILQLYIAMYNYIYTYREVAIPNYKDGTSNFENQDIIDQRATTKAIIDYYNENNLVNDASSDDARIKAITDAAKAATEGKYITYKAQDLKDLDSGLYDYIYETLNTPSPEDESVEYNRFSTTDDKYTSDNYQYMVYKISQEYTDDDKPNQNEQGIIDDTLSTDDVYQNILDSTSSVDGVSLYDRIIKDLTNEDLTNSYISEKLTAATNEVKVKIFDSAIEISYAVNNSDYNRTLSGAPDSNTVATFTYEDRTLNSYVTTEDGKGLYDILEYRSGITVAANLISHQMMKDTEAYKNIPQEVIDSFYSTIELILASFANDGLSSSGYPASIGKYNFLMLYYHTSDIDEIVNDVYKVSYVSQQQLIDYSSDKVIDFFHQFSTKAYENYFSVTAQNLSVYLDIDEDGKADDINTWKDKTVTLDDGTSKTYPDMAKELIAKINNLISASSDTHTDALSTIVENYNSSSRYNPHEGGQFDKNDGYYDPIGNEWDFSIYKKLGFAVTTSEITVTNSSTDVDLAIKDMINKIYNSDDFKINNNFPTAYLPDVDSTTVEANDSINYFIITSATGPSSAKYEEKNDTYSLYKDIYYMYNENLIKVDNVYNDGDILNQNQIKAYLLEYIASSTSNLLPSDISDSITNYLSPVLTRFQDNGTQFEIILNYIASGDINKLDFNDDSNDERVKLLLEINQRAADEYVDYGDDDSYNNFAGWWTSLKELFVAGGNN